MPKLDLVLPLSVRPSSRDLRLTTALLLSLELNPKFKQQNQLSIISADDLNSTQSDNKNLATVRQLVVQTACADRLPLLIVDSMVVLFEVEAALSYIWNLAAIPVKQRQFISQYVKCGKALLEIEDEDPARDADRQEQLLAILESKFDEWSKLPIMQSLVFAACTPFHIDRQLPQRIKTWLQSVSHSDAFKTAQESARSYCTVKDSVKLRDGLKRAMPLKSKVLPENGRRNILITSALPYVNNVPHLGNIIGCVLSADVFARYCRLRGYNTLYICGTDEYGTATETKALEEKVSCQEICDRYHAIHANVYKWFDIEFDIFGRTSTPKHNKISQEIFLRLLDKKLLFKNTVEQLYSEKLQKFLADRYVEGQCPFCGYPDARGDQCDGCGKTLDNPTQLINARCKFTGTTPILRQSEHMYLDLEKLQPKCEQWANKASEKGFWSSNGKSITNAWFKEGLLPRCITRDLEWGTKVPLPEMANKVLYVWFDAPIGYLSITANYTDQWEQWWKNPDNVELFQFMGKDNVPFHTVIFPCTLLGTEDPYTMLHHLSTTEYLQYEGDKFSKSRGIGVFGNNVMESGIPVEVWRYYLLACRPENSDSMFSWSDLGMRTNSELLANLGNFINRALKFLKVKYAACVPSSDLDDADKTVINDIYKLLKDYIEALEAVKIRQGLLAIMEISARGNAYLQESKLDNTLFENNPKKCATVMHISVNIIYLLSALIEPYMPSTSKEILRQLNAPRRQIPDIFSLDILPGHRIGNPEHLFRRLEEKTLQSLFMKYGGEAILEKRRKAAAGEKAEKKKKKKPANSSESSAPVKQQ